MKKLNFSMFALFFSLILSGTGAVCAQGQQSLEQDAAKRQTPEQNSNQPSNFLQLLNLTPAQIQQIRAVNQETRENVRTANQRQREARRALDAAIYADTPNQAEVDERARELGEAQAEAIKRRAQVEFRIRQLLTAEQLIRFRDLRRQFEQKIRDQLFLQKKSLRQSNNKPF